MTSHWEFLNQILCEDIVRHVIQPYLLPSVETSIAAHKWKWKDVLGEIEQLHRRWRNSRQSHILVYYFHFHRPTIEEYKFYYYDVDECDLDSHFPKIVEILPQRFSSLIAYHREPDDQNEMQYCTYWPDTDEVSFGESSRKWVKSFRPRWWWKLQKGYKYLRRARYRLSCC